VILPHLSRVGLEASEGSISLQQLTCRRSLARRDAKSGSPCRAQYNTANRDTLPMEKALPSVAASQSNGSSCACAFLVRPERTSLYDADSRWRSSASDVPQGRLTHER
jgi:hypothetical protein